MMKLTDLPTELHDLIKSFLPLKDQLNLYYCKKGTVFGSRLIEGEEQCVEALWCIWYLARYNEYDRFDADHRFNRILDHIYGTNKDFRMTFIEESAEFEFNYIHDRHILYKMESKVTHQTLHTKLNYVLIETVY